MDVLVADLAVFASLPCALPRQLVLPIFPGMLVLDHILYRQLVVLPNTLRVSVGQPRLTSAGP